jgi:hypothetical protein
MSSKHLHIISFDVPFPADYGGVIDVFYKIRALHQAGYRVHLHCFEYGRPHAPQLEAYCEQVYYYERRMSKRYLFHPLPFIVVTRRSERLMQVLLKDNYPILFEGLHSCYHLPDPRLQGRKLLVRTHNIEHDYYDNLAKVESSTFRKAYFRREASKLRKYEQVLQQAAHILAISRPDQDNLKKRYERVELLSAFHPNEQVNVGEGLGKFALYHGNLEVGENNEAALFLVQQVFPDSSVPLVIAGKNPSTALQQAVAKQPSVRLLANIPTSEIDALIRAAQINILPTFQATGIKLKLLAALFNGRHCLVNSPMVMNTGLEKLCEIQDTAQGMRLEAEKLMQVPFGSAAVSQRTGALFPDFSNEENVRRLTRLL